MHLDEALTRWLDYLGSLGMDMSSQFRPGASGAAVEAAGAAIGYRLPEDLAALYRFADGQRSSVAVAEEPGSGAVGPFFGLYEFLPLDEAVSHYRTWLEIYEEAGEEFASLYDWTRARAGDAVHGDYWRPGWFPFSHDGGGNSLAVDLAPPEGGATGQIILIGRDEDERRVLARSLTDLLAEAACRRPPIVQREGRWIAVDIEQAGPAVGPS
jgi:cell wall assembly regulator SMI1